MKRVDNRIIEEISRYKSINDYIFEQEATLPPPPEEGILPPADPSALPPPPADAGALPPPPGIEPPAAPGAVPTPVDIATDPDVEKVGEEKGKTEELDISDLVNSQKQVEKKQEEYFDNLFAQLKTLEEKLGEMDGLVTTINNLETKFDKFRPKTPQEKLELRSLDSGPFNQKLSDFFQDKEPDMEKSGKNEYVLTTDDANNYSTNDVETSFNNYDDEDTNMM